MTQITRLVGLQGLLQGLPRVASFAVSALAACVPAPAQAGGVGGAAGGGSTELTQILNNVELAASVGKQAQMVSNQILQYTTMLNQYATMVENLKNLPAGVIGNVIGPLANTVQTYTNAYNSVKGVYTAVTNVQTMFDRRVAEIGASNLSPTDYMRNRFLLAQTKGGGYAEQVQTDLRTLEETRIRAQAMKEASNAIPGITGNVQGLQLLNTQTNQMVGELMDLKQAVVRQGMLTFQQAEDREKGKADAAKVDEYLVELDRVRREARGTETVSAFGAPRK